MVSQLEEQTKCAEERQHQAEEIGTLHRHTIEVVTRTLSKSVYLGARRAYSQRHRARRFPRPRGETMKSSLLSTLLLGVASTLPLAMAQSPGTFTPTGDLTEPRREHTATLLTNGKVLIAGGTGNSLAALAARSCTILPPEPSPPRAT